MTKRKMVLLLNDEHSEWSLSVHVKSELLIGWLLLSMYYTSSCVSHLLSEKRRKPSPNAGGDIRRKARRALKINQVLTDSERRL